MGGFVDPFVPEPAWPQDTMFISSSWSGNDPAGTYLGEPAAAAQAQGTQFHLPTVSSTVGTLLTKEMIVSPVEELHEQFLSAHLPQPDADVTQHQQGLLGFEVDSGSALVGGAGTGTLGSLLTTPCAISLADSAPVVCSSNDSSGSEQSGLPRFLLGDQQQQHAWPPSTFPQISSLLVGEETSQSFSFSSNHLLLREAAASVAADAKKYPPQLLGNNNVPAETLQLHDDDVEFNTGKMMLSFTPGLGQQLNSSANFGDLLELSQKEFSGLHHLNLSGLQLSSFNATGATHNPEQSSEVSSGKTGLNTPQFMARPEAMNANGAAGSGAPKPRVRARRGQATDPHSIAERLRREKISDRMKNLQELVPNSNRTDKASMLEEIIEYVKFLQLQVKVLSMSRLGATEAVVPLLTESQTESSGGLLLSPRSGSSGRQRAGRGSSLPSSSPPPEVRDGAAFEQEVAQLMESNMTTAMQYLQSKGLCLMPIALASAISDHKGASSAAVQPPENAAAKEMLRAVKPLGSPIQGR